MAGPPALRLANRILLCYEGLSLHPRVSAVP